MSQCCEPLSLEKVLAHGALVLDAEAPEEDPNDLETFLKLEGLLLIVLLANNKSPSDRLRTHIRRVVNQFDPIEQPEFTISGIRSGLKEYRESVIPKQQDTLKKSMVDIAERTKRENEKNLSLFSSPLTNEPKFDLGVRVQSASWNNLSIPFTDQDMLAMDYLSKAQALYAGRYFDEKMIKMARGIITRDYSLYGDSPEVISQIVKDNLVSMVDVTPRYWQTVVTNALNNARTYANLKSFDAANIQYFEFVAVIDERTSKICRALHQRVFPVRPALERMERAIQANEISDLQKFTPMVKNLPGGDGFSIGGFEFDATVSDADLIANGVIIPPLHFLCRSTIRPYEG